jgi:lipopolysaccharide heptosyltransferase II
MSIKTLLITDISRLLSALFPQHPLPSNPRRIIVIKPCCLGDVVLATAAIAALKRRYSQAQIDVAVGRWSRAVLEYNPHIRLLVDSGPVGQGRYGLPDGWSLAQRLRQNRYDLAVTMVRSPMVGLVPWLAGIKHRVGLDSSGRGFAHTVRVSVPEEPRHEALIYLDCIAATGLAAANQKGIIFRTEFYPTETDRATLPPLTKTPFVIIHPAGGVNPGMRMLDKRWPSERMAALADRFSLQGFHIVLTGAAGDLPFCWEVASRMTYAEPQILAGCITLGQFGALCQKAALFVGGDTGAMHVAVATGCKTIAIFGPSDPNRYAPFAPPTQARFLWHEVQLPSGGVGQGRVIDFSWERGVSVDEVWAACAQLLGV